MKKYKYIDNKNHKPTSVIYPFMLRDNLIVYIKLPLKITQKDVKRITKMLLTLCFDDEPSGISGELEIVNDNF